MAFLIDEASASPTWWGTQLLEKFPKDTGASPVNAIKLPYSSLLQVPVFVYVHILHLPCSSML